MVKKPRLVEIDLSQTTAKGGAGLEAGPTYLVLYDGRFYSGKFDMERYGLNFSGIYFAGAKYDPPGQNFSSWQRIWKISNAQQISEEAEPEYKRLRREHAISYGMVSNGQRIDETTPLDAYGYVPTVPAMPKKEEDDFDADYNWREE